MCSSSRVLSGPSRHGGNSLSVMPVAAMDSVARPLAASLQIGACAQPGQHSPERTLLNTCV